MVGEPHGELFGAYRIEDLLGRGGMSVVYRAEQVQLGRKVALKLLAPELARDEEFRRRFIRESRAAAAIDHPNVVPVYEAGEIDGVLYIAMRYVVGADLAGILAREGPLDVDRALHLLSQTASALDAAHAAGLVHRDVKPANILVTGPRGALDPEHAYLSDFGLTKMAPGRSTTTGTFLGTVSYVAPEQIQGHPIDARADVYSLGCVLFECLAGSPPFRRDNEVATMYAHVHDRPPALSARRPDLGPALDDVVARALAKEAADRFPTAGALMEAVRRAVDTPALRRTAIGGTPALGTGTPPPRARRRTNLAAGAAVAVLAAVVVVVAVTTGRDREPPAEPQPEPLVEEVRLVDGPTISGRTDGVRLVKGQSTDYWLTSAVGTAPGTSVAHTAQWATPISGGTYRIEVFIPVEHGQASVAYEVRFDDGRSVTTAVVDQAKARGSWADLGTYALAGSRATIASDDFADGPGSEIAWGQARWTRIGPVRAEPPVVVDDPTSFSGSTKGIERLTDTGHDNDLWRTFAVGETQVADNAAEWRAGIAPGRYRVDVFVPGAHTVASVNYTAHARAGAAVVQIRQGLFGNEWVTIGTYDLAGTTATVTSDDAGSPAAAEMAWDAVRWTRVV